MPIIDIELIGAAELSTAGSEAPALNQATVQSLSDQLGEILSSPPRETWIRFRKLPRSQYAENGAQLPPRIRPVFVEILQADLPSDPPRDILARTVAETIGSVLERPAENVHIIFAPPGRGRVAFGGHLLE